MWSLTDPSQLVRRNHQVTIDDLSFLKRRSGKIRAKVEANGKYKMRSRNEFFDYEFKLPLISGTPWLKLSVKRMQAVDRSILVSDKNSFQYTYCPTGAIGISSTT